MLLTALVWLGVCIFLLRVLGQAYVALYRPLALPPMGEWYSGLVPYGALLAGQIVLLMVLVVVAYDFTRQSGWFYVTDRTASGVLSLLGLAYAGAMLVRLGVRLARYPLRPWYSGRSIPIALHLVLTTILLVVARYPALA